ncbi:MAG: hypothetical protein RML36_09430 [Anaerolineae bacterium]|nr:hypothetical protein [Anaerolineae bacterium]MDW8099685.1 hypothetical protein [Anaerolineae bacterium]
MFEPLSLFLSFLAIGMALYAVCLARKIWQTIEAEGPLALWEEQVTELSEDLTRTAQQISAHLSRRREELLALIARAENITDGSQMPEAKRAKDSVSTDEPAPDASVTAEMACPVIAMEDQRLSAKVISQATRTEEPSEVNRQVRFLASQGINVVEIARQTRLSQEEIIMRLNTSA